MSLRQPAVQQLPLRADTWDRSYASAAKYVVLCKAERGQGVVDLALSGANPSACHLAIYTDETKRVSIDIHILRLLRNNKHYRQSVSV